MKFAIALKGENVSENICCCDSFIVYEEKCGNVITRQNIAKMGQGAQPLSDFLSKFAIESFLCEKMNETELRELEGKGILAVKGVSGKADIIAEHYAAKAKKQAKMKSCLQPAPKVLVSCRGLDGENNVLAVAYCGNCSYDPPMVMVGIVPTRYSYKMIKESGCFIVNLVDKNYGETFNYLGSHSKRDGDKLEAMNVQMQEGKKVKASFLPDCPVNIECTVVDSIVTGSHEMFIGKIEYVHANSKITDDKGNIDFSQINFI